MGVAGTLVEIFKNGVPHPSGSFLPGDEVKIKPLAIGAGNISWVCNQNGCATGGAVSFNICSAPMPILFQNQPIAKVHNNKTQITWSVASQLNNEKYIIEHSNPDSYREALNFSSIGEIAGDGTSNETKHYEYIHTSTSIGINYYRIKQVDYDGKYSYSDIASVQYSDNGETNIYPNPAISEVNIITTAPTLLQIMDVYGRVHSKQEISEGQNTINLSALPTGIYHVGINNQRIKLIKL